MLYDRVKALAVGGDIVFTGRPYRSISAWAVSSVK